MKNLLNKFNKLNLLLIFILSLTPLLWFRGNSILVGHDNVFPLNPTVFLEGRLSTWVDQQFGMSQSLIMGTIPTHLIDALPYLAGLPLQLSQKIVYIFWFFVMGASAYALAYVLNPKSRVFQLTAVILYQFNFFILQGWFIGERTKFAAYAALPLVLAIFYKVYKKEITVLKAVLICSLVGFVFNGGGLYGVPLYGGFFIAVGSFVIFFGLISYFKRQFLTIRRLLSLVVGSLVGGFIVNAYFIFPALTQVASKYNSGVQQIGGTSGFIDWASEISAFASYSNIFRLQGIPEWSDNPFHPFANYYFHNPLLILMSFVFPLTIFSAVYFSKKHEAQDIILYFFFVYLIGIVFTAGTHPPLGFIYAFLIQHIPGFIVFRSPYYKFAPAVFLSASFLIAYFFDSLKSKYKTFLTVLFLALVLVYHFPFFTGSFFNWKPGFSTRNSIPSYVFDFSNWLNKEKNNDGRVLVLPPNDPALQYGTYDWGYLSYQSLTSLLSNKQVVINNDQINKEEQSLLLNLDQSIVDNNGFVARKLSSLLGFKYIVVEKDKILDSYASFPSDSKAYDAFLNTNAQFEKSFGKWDLYKIKSDPLPLFFTNEGISILHGGVDDSLKLFSIIDKPIVSLKTDIGDVGFLPRSNFYFPECINCPNDKNRTVVSFPTANILPGSPFYQFVILRERLQRPKDTKARVYDDVGDSLKRISEIRALGIRDGKIQDNVLAQFDNLMLRTTSDFNQLNKLEDKIQLADDLNYYMKAEKSYILQAQDAFINTGSPVTLDFAKVYSIISRFLNSIDSYIFKQNPANNRLYRLTLDNDGQYNFLLGKNELKSVLTDGSTARMDLDGKTLKEIRLDSSFQNSETLSFGTTNIVKGVHYLSLAFPESSSSATLLSPGIVDFSFYDQSNCYVTKMNNFTDRRLYKVSVNYKNDFAIDLVFYIWEQKGNVKKLLNLAKLPPSITDQEYHQYERANADSSDLWAGVCSSALTNDILNRKISITAEEILFPSVMIVPTSQVNISINNIEYKKISSTKYNIFIPEHQSSIILNFMDRFDKGWVLSSFNESHFRSELFGNGWEIPRSGSLNLTLQYQPENSFSAGAAVSIISVIAILIYLLKNKRNEEL